MTVATASPHPHLLNPPSGCTCRTSPSNDLRPVMGPDLSHVITSSSSYFVMRCYLVIHPSSLPLQPAASLQGQSLAACFVPGSPVCYTVVSSREKIIGGGGWRLGVIKAVGTSVSHFLALLFGTEFTLGKHQAWHEQWAAISFRLAGSFMWAGREINIKSIF